MNGFRYEHSLHKIIIAALLLLHCVLQYTLYIHIFSQGNVTKNIKLMPSKSNPHFETTDTNPDRTITQSEYQTGQCSIFETYLSRAGCNEISYNTCTSLQSHGCKKLCKAFHVYKHHLCPEMHVSIVYRVLHVLLGF